MLQYMQYVWYLDIIPITFTKYPTYSFTLPSQLLIS